MNKKIIILSVVLLLVIGGAGFFYMDTLIGLFTGEKNQETNLMPQQPQKSPAEKMPPVQVFEKAFEKIYAPTLKNFGIEEFSEVNALKFIVKTNIEFTDEFLKGLPKTLQKFKTVDLNFELTADKKNNNFLLAMESVISKKFQLSSFNGLTSLCFPDLKEIYSVSAEDLSKILPFPLPSFSNNNPNGDSNLKDESEEKDEESKDDASSGDEESGEKKASEKQVNQDTQTEAGKPADNEGAKDKKLIDKIKEEFEFVREKGEAQNVKIILTPKNKTANSPNSPESIILFVHKNNFTIEKIEVSGKNLKTNQPVSIVSTFEYGESGNINKVSTLESEKDAEPKNSSLSLNYNEGLVESLKIDAENVNEIINFSYNDEKKFAGIRFEKNIEGIGKFNLQISDFAINAEYGENDFIINGTEKFKKKTSEDFNKAISSGKLAKQVLKVNEKDLKLAGDMIFAKVMTSIMSSAKTESASVETPESEEGGKPAEEKEIQKSNNKQTVEDEEADEDDEQIENESPKQSSSKKSEPLKKIAKKPEEKKNSKPAAKVKEETEDEESGEDEEVKKAQPAKIEKKKPEPVEEAPEPKEEPKPRRRAVSDDNLINDVAAREYSPTYAAIVKQYNSNKTDKVQLLPQIEEVLKSEPNNVEALYMAALINFQNIKNNDEAVKYFDLVLKSANLNSKVERQIYYWARMLKKQILNSK